MLVEEETSDPFQTLLSCVEEHTGESCEEIYDACEDEAEGVAVVVDDVTTGVERDNFDREAAESGEYQGSERESLGDDLREVFSGGGEETEEPEESEEPEEPEESEEPEVPSNPDAGVSGQTPGDETADSDDGGGCSINGAGSPFALLAFLPILGLLIRRRQD